MKMLLSLLVLGLAIAALTSCGLLQGAGAALTGGPSSPPPGAVPPGSTSELLYVGGYAVIREALGWLLRRRSARAEDLKT